ncbi:hypothetical protein FGG08_004590 [Glutinoglossum americanum]|uniref:Uncharacterized protein n=1 Tax=Glutinoglossum americanum TaxID=1670608 RepID=A0A9P8L3R8_9PEZI|nr:hypothetical protein FGG08_004590 [Glutinoglossum americanum]
MSKPESPSIDCGIYVCRYFVKRPTTRDDISLPPRGRNIVLIPLQSPQKDYGIPALRIYKSPSSVIALQREVGFVHMKDLIDHSSARYSKLGISTEPFRQYAHGIAYRDGGSDGFRYQRGDTFWLFDRLIPSLETGGNSAPVINLRTSEYGVLRVNDVCWYPDVRGPGGDLWTVSGVLREIRGEIPKLYAYTIHRVNQPVSLERQGFGQARIDGDSMPKPERKEMYLQKMLAVGEALQREDQISGDNSSLNSPPPSPTAVLEMQVGGALQGEVNFFMGGSITIPAASSPPTSPPALMDETPQKDDRPPPDGPIPTPTPSSPLNSPATHLQKMLSMSGVIQLGDQPFVGGSITIPTASSPPTSPPALMDENPQKGDQPPPDGSMPTPTASSPPNSPATHLQKMLSMSGVIQLGDQPLAGGSITIPTASSPPTSPQALMEETPQKDDQPPADGSMPTPTPSSLPNSPVAHLQKMLSMSGVIQLGDQPSVGGSVPVSTPSSPSASLPTPTPIKAIPPGEKAKRKAGQENLGGVPFSKAKERAKRRKIERESRATVPILPQLTESTPMATSQSDGAQVWLQSPKSDDEYQIQFSTSPADYSFWPTYATTIDSPDPFDSPELGLYTNFESGHILEPPEILANALYEQPFPQLCRLYGSFLRESPSGAIFDAVYPGRCQEARPHHCFVSLESYCQGPYTPPAAAYGMLDIGASQAYQGMQSQNVM